MSKGKPKPIDEIKFEDAMGELDALIESIEQGEVGLEESITAYERGVALVGRCKSILERAEQKVEDLTQRLAEEDTEATGNG